MMQACGPSPYVTFKGKWHTIDDVGINPRPPRGKIPLWFGGHMEVTLQRVAKWGDGWMMLAHPPDPRPSPTSTNCAATAEAAGRDPATIGLEVWTSTGTGAEASGARRSTFWKKAGVTHVTLHNTFGGYHHKRMAGRTMTDHIAAMRRYRTAVADLL